jgi:hypothetical protein
MGSGEEVRRRAASLPSPGEAGERPGGAGGPDWGSCRWPHKARETPDARASERLGLLVGKEQGTFAVRARLLSATSWVALPIVVCCTSSCCRSACHRQLPGAAGRARRPRVHQRQGAHASRTPEASAVQQCSAAAARKASLVMNSARAEGLRATLHRIVRAARRRKCAPSQRKGQTKAVVSGAAHSLRPTAAAHRSDGSNSSVAAVPIL